MNLSESMRISSVIPTNAAIQRRAKRADVGSGWIPEQAGDAAAGRFRKLVAWLTLISFLGQTTISVADGIVADPSAPASQRPTVLNAANGVPQVNIQTPSAAGVSRNTYSQFDVQQQGVILNNARTNTQTQLGGWIQGNPSLAAGTARIILNEVNSSNPSLLQGYVEVAGDRAQVVIANPAGVTCDGCGFINANRATLTTGTPVMNGGSLDGYLVQRGQVTISGSGLDASQTDYTDIIARSVQINAGIWANDLKVTAGANRVGADHTQITPVVGSVGAPAFAIDVAQLGGMYAGKIHLIGTEAGVGVRNAGNIGASAGEVVVTVDGRLENAGSLTAATNVGITAGDIANSGTIYAQGNATLVTDGDIANSGTIAAQGNTTLTATGMVSRIDSTASAVLGAGIKAEGTLAASGNLTVGATQAIAAHGQNLAGGDLSMTAGGIDLADSRTSGQSLTLTANTGELDASRAVIDASGILTMQAAQTLRTDDATASASQLSLAAQDLSNIGGELVQTGNGDLAINLPGTLDNTQGRIAANSANLALSAQVLTNTDGAIEHAGTGMLTLSAALLDNVGGTIAANRDVVATAASVANTQGIIGSVQGGVAVTATGGAIDNTAGRIEAAQDIALAGDGLTNTDGVVNGFNVVLDSHAQALDNTRGFIAAQGALDIGSGQLTNDAGLIQAAGAATIDTHGQTLANINSGTAGGIVGQSTVTLTTGDLNNQAGFIGAKGNLTAVSAAITNTQGGVLTGESALTLTGTSLDNRGGQVQALGNLSVDTGSGAIDNTASLLRSGRALAITAGSVVNANTQGTDQGIEGQSVAIAASQINNQSGAIRADDTLALTGHGTLDNTHGLISSSNIVSIADSNIADKALAVTNTGGTIIAATNLAIDSASLTGDGKVLSQGDLSAKLVHNYTHTGEFQADGNATLTTAGTITNQAKLAAGNTLTLTAATIDNQAAGQIVADSLTLTATDAHTLINRGLINGQDTFIDTLTLNNIGTGRIYGDHVAIAADTLTNSAETVNGVTRTAVIAARDRLDIGANIIANSNGALLFSAGDMAIGGSLDADHQATGQTTTLTNTSATIEALGDLDIAAAALTNQRNEFSITRQNLGTTTTYETICLDPGDCDYISYLTHQRTDYQDVVSSNAPSATISAGGNGVFAIGNLTNQYSTIEVGGNLSLTGNTLTNTGAELYLQTDRVESGYYRHWGRGPRGVFSYTTSTSTLLETAPAIISAGGSLTGSFTGRIDNQTIRQNSAPVTAASGTTTVALNTGNVGQSAEGANGATAAVGDTQSVATITQIAAVDVGGASTPGSVIRTVSPNTALPANSLFATASDPAAHYLIETDPQFASYRTWSSSDYMLSQLSLDPASTQKRLGDGFYEQKLVREQLAQLTGRRFLTGYSDDEAQYQALMTAGVTVAQAWNLTPGIALTDAQVAQLTSDIVWLVEKEVAQPDGSRIKVLVPQVYVRLQDGDLNADGALLAADSLQLDAGGDLNNSGNLNGRSIARLTADNLTNLGGRIRAGDRLDIATRQDLTVESSTADIAFAQSGSRRSPTVTAQRTQINRIAGLYVDNPGGTLAASAGRDLHLNGAEIVNNGGAAGQTVLAAARDINLGSVTETSNSYAQAKKSWQRTSSSTEIGSSIQTDGDLALVAGRDLTARAAAVESHEGVISAVAGRDLTLTTGAAVSHTETYDKRSKKSAFSSKKSVTRTTLDQTTQQSTTFSGDSVSLDAGRDLTIQGSNVVATNDVNLAAQNNLSIETAANTRTSTYYNKTSKSGVFSSGGVGLTAGSQKLKTTNDTQVTTNVASTVGSTNGDVTIEAGKHYTQTGSNVLALQGDIAIAASQVDITAATDTYANQQATKFKQSGLSVGLSGGIISAVQNTLQETKAASNSGDNRVRQLANVVMALDDASSIKSNIIGMQQGYDKGGIEGAAKASGISLNISIGTSKSSSSTSITTTQAVASNITAGGDIDIRATGAGQDSDMTIQGSSLQAGKDITLKADDTINLVAAQNTAEQHSKNKSSSASVGVSIGISADGVGVGLNASASQARGKADGRDVVYSNTHIDAGNQLTLESGGDTTLKGAVATGEQVTANVGGNLNLESLQDTSTYKSKQQSVGIGLSVPIMGGGAAGGSLSASSAKAKGNYASVVEQTGIKAGDEGFNITTQGNTDLTGAIIASNEKAVQDNKNSLTTGTLSYSNLQNTSSASASSDGINLTQDLFSKYGAARTALSSAYQNIDESEHRSSVTQSAIEQGTINITATNTVARNISEDNALTISRDTQNANQPLIKLDAQAMEQQVAREAQLRAADVALVTRVTDDAYRVMFRETPKFYKATCPANKDCVANPKLVQVEPVTGTPEEIQAKITQNGDANTVLAVNGIQNGIDRGVELAFQNAAMVDKTEQNPDGNKPQTIYLMHYQPANNTVGEMLVAGYEKLLTQVDSDTANFLGYTNPDMTYAQTLQGFGNNAVNSLGHSRGTLVQQNAFNTLNQNGITNGQLTVRAFGPAANQQELADAAVGVIGVDQKRLEPNQISINYFANDPVATLSGGNPGNSGLMALRDLWAVLTGGDNTQHSCGGTGAPGCLQVETPIAGKNEGTHEGNAMLIQYWNGQRIDNNPVGR